jgi:hypothetical protein
MLSALRKRLGFVASAVEDKVPSTVAVSTTVAAPAAFRASAVLFRQSIVDVVKAVHDVIIPSAGAGLSGYPSEIQKSASELIKATEAAFAKASEAEVAAERVLVLAAVAAETAIEALDASIPSANRVTADVAAQTAVEAARAEVAKAQEALEALAQVDKSVLHLDGIGANFGAELVV